MSKILLGFADWNNDNGHLADYGIVIENNISIPFSATKAERVRKTGSGKPLLEKIGHGRTDF